MESSEALEIERVIGAARDALTDEMVGRVTATAAEGMDLLARSWSRTAIWTAWSRWRAPSARRRTRLPTRWSGACSRR
jgi:hypothetical protein